MRALKAYRRHWRKDHWLPFCKEAAESFRDEISAFSVPAGQWSDPKYPHVRRDVQEAWGR